MVDRRGFLHSLPAGVLGALLPLKVNALQEGKPSQTALATALQRAAHQLLENPIVFEDPVSLKILGADRVRWLGMNLARFRTRPSRVMRAFLVARSRYAEDELACAYKRGIRQYIVLGAGLDTFAYRNPYGAHLRVFEVDHPSTQAWKRAALREHGIDAPRSLTFVSVDFEKQSLADRLRLAGFRRSAPVFISWLGVTMYLTRDAVMQTLRFVAQSCAKESEIVFDFAPPDEALGDGERAFRDRRAQRVAAIGEPWITSFDPDRLAKELADIGFSHVSSIGAAEANRLYFANRADRFAFRGSTRILTARLV